MEMINEQAIDMLREFINVGMGEAAAALSDLVKTRVIIKVPEVSVIDVSNISEFLGLELSDLGDYLSQDFHGDIERRSILFYTEECSMALLEALLEGRSELPTLTESGRATLQEVGNIILVSCISSISDMIELQTIFEMPVVTVETSDVYFRNMMKELERVQKAIVVKNQIAVHNKEIYGYLVVLLSFDYFEVVVNKLEKLSEKYAAPER
jgi:chemotaxis protein CheC